MPGCYRLQYDKLLIDGRTSSGHVGMPVPLTAIYMLEFLAEIRTKSVEGFLITYQRRTRRRAVIASVCDTRLYLKSPIVQQFAAGTQQGSDRSPCGDGIRRISAMPQRVLVALGCAATGTVHPAGRPAPNRRRLARLPRSFRFRSAHAFHGGIVPRRQPLLECRTLPGQRQERAQGTKFFI